MQVLLRNFTNTLWQLYIDFYTIRMVFESSFQLCTFKVANLKKLWQFWQKCVDRTFVHAVRLNLRQIWHIGLLCPNDLQCKEQLTSAQRFYRNPLSASTIEPLCTQKIVRDADSSIFRRLITFPVLRI